MLRVLRKVLVFMVGAAAVFLLANLGLTTALFAGAGQLNRFTADAERLRAAVQWGRLDAQTAFRRVYGDALGDRPSPERLHGHYREALARKGPAVFDQAMAAYALDRYGQVDSRVLPPGVYIGMRSIGPDHPPLVGVTKYLINYTFFPRHSFVLVVTPPVGGRHRQAVTFSAGPKEDFVPAGAGAMTTYAILHPYRPGEYDFPNEGQAIHELFQLSGDPRAAARAVDRLQRAARVIQASGTDYRPVARNSNTVVGCLLRHSGALTNQQEAALGDWPVALTAVGIGFRLPLPAPRTLDEGQGSSLGRTAC